MRRPRFTLVSDGKPLRRLLVRSKAGFVVIVIVMCHTASGVEMMMSAVGGVRTCDLRFTKAALCRLSYDSVVRATRVELAWTDYGFCRL